MARRPGRFNYSLTKITERMPEVPPQVLTGDDMHTEASFTVQTGVPDPEPGADLPTVVDTGIGPSAYMPSQPFAPVTSRPAPPDPAPLPKDYGLAWWERAGYSSPELAHRNHEYDPDAPSPSSVRKMQRAMEARAYSGHKTPAEVEDEANPNRHNAFADAPDLLDW